MTHQVKEDHDVIDEEVVNTLAEQVESLEVIKEAIRQARESGVTQEQINEAVAVNENMVEVHFFKPSGKWYTTEVIEWPTELFEVDFHLAFKSGLQEKIGKRLAEMTAFCPHPYHMHSHPIALAGWND